MASSFKALSFGSGDPKETDVENQLARIVKA